MDAKIKTQTTTLLFLVHSPYLSVGGWSLSDDGAGLRRGQGLLDHYAGIMVAHPWVGMLVLALASLAMQWDALQQGEKSKQRLKICEEFFQASCIFSTTHAITTVCPWAPFTQPEWVMRTYVNYHGQTFSGLSWGNTDSQMKNRFFLLVFAQQESLLVVPLLHITSQNNSVL